MKGAAVTRKDTIEEPYAEGQRMYMENVTTI
jgi:hypothetical protein